MIDKRHIGHVFPPVRINVERSRLLFFSKAIGDTDPVYSDLAAAHAAGYRDLPVPPTFLFCLEMEARDPAVMRELLGIDVRRVLHGEQEFVYHAMAFAGDQLNFEQRIDDIYEKKAGALEFLVRKTRVTNQHDELIADLRCVIVIRNE